MTKIEKTINNKKTNNSNQNKQFIQEIKLKPLIPTLRLKKRFIKFKVISEKKFEFKELSENLNQEILIFIGVIEYGKSGIWILRDKFDFENQELIIKVSTKLKDKLIGVLSLITQINQIPCKLETMKVSGTLKGFLKK